MERYRVISETVRAENGALHTAYGIRCGALFIGSVCANRSELLFLAQQCNRERLEPVHLEAVVCDFLAALR